jgi:hypothetical protein
MVVILRGSVESRLAQKDFRVRCLTFEKPKRFFLAAFALPDKNSKD